MHAHDGFYQPFIVPHQAAEAGLPGERSLDDPATRQQDETMLGLRQLDHVQFDAFVRRRRTKPANPRCR